MSIGAIQQSPEQLVDQIIAFDKKKHEKEVEEGLQTYYTMTEDDWVDRKTTYLEIENLVRSHFDQIPVWEPDGSLHYGMTLEKMKEVVGNKLKEMANSGQLILKSSLHSRHDPATLHYVTGSDNLTRIWGANFLKDRLKNKEDIDAAMHFLVVDDESKSLSIEVGHNNNLTPTLKIVKNAFIVSQKILGTPCAVTKRYYLAKELDEVRYRDFKDPGNVIEDSEGKKWIVDTETKSFDSPTDVDNELRRYLKKRFRILTGEEYKEFSQSFSFSLAELGLL